MVVLHRGVHRGIVVVYRTVVEAVDVVAFQQVARSPVGIAVRDVVGVAHITVLKVVKTDSDMMTHWHYGGSVPLAVHFHPQGFQIVHKDTVHLCRCIDGKGKQYEYQKFCLQHIGWGITTAGCGRL